MNIDPMLTDQAEEYKKSLVQKIKDQIDIDREERKSIPDESPVLIGGNGLSSNLVQTA